MIDCYALSFLMILIHIEEHWRLLFEVGSEVQLQFRGNFQIKFSKSHHLHLSRE